MITDHLHSTVAPCAAAGISCAIGFNLHEVLGYIGQIVGICSGVLSMVWVGYQILRARKK